MADNVALPLSGTGQSTANIATDDVGGVQYQRVKISFGVDGSATDASAVDPLPVVYSGGLHAGANNIGHVTVDNFPAVGDEDSAKPGDLIVVGGTDGTVAKTLKLDSNNSLLVSTVGTQTVNGSIVVSSLPVGANNIGDVDVLTLPGLATGANTIGAIASIVSGLPTGANTIGGVTDGGGSLTVDNPSLSVVGGGAEATALRVTIATDSTGVLSVDDNGGSLTVDGSVAVTGLPAGANALGSVSVSGLPVGANNIGDVDVLTLPGLASGVNSIGSVVVSGLPAGANTIGNVVVNSITAGLPTGANTIGAVTVSGTVAVTDNSGSLTVDNPVLSVVGGGLEATAQRVTLASDSTGILSVDDNGGSLTVDGSVAVTGLPVGANNIGDVDVLTLPGLSTGANTIGAVTVSGTVAVTDNAGSLTVDNPTLSIVGTGTEATALRVTIATDSTGVLSVDDNGGSLTVDGSVAITGLPTGANTIGTVVASSLTAGLPTGANTIGAVVVNSITAGLPTGANTIGAVASIVAGLPTGANTIGAVTSVEAIADNGAFIDGTSKVSASGYIYDEVAGTALSENDIAAARINLNRAQVHLIEDGVTRGRWATVTAANAVKTDGSAVTQPVSGTVVVSSVTAGLPTGANTIGAVTVSGTVAVTDNSGSLTVDNPVLSVVGGGLEATAQRVTIASDSTGVLSVDDNGGSLTVDGSVAITGLPTGANTIGAVASIVAGLPTGANTIGAINNADSIADNGGFTDGTSKVFPSGYVYDEVAGTTLSENDVAAARINLNRAQVGIIEDGATRGRWATVTAGNNLRVDLNTGLPTGANTIGAVASIVAGLPTGANTIGSVGVTAITAGLPTGANTIGAVASIVAGLPTGANTIGAVTVSSNVTTTGTVAHDAVDAGNPHKIGAKAVAHGTNPTAVAAADRTDLYANRHGVLFTIGGHPNIQTLRVPITAAQTDVALVTVAGGTKLVVTRLSTIVAYSTTVDTVVRIGFGAASTPTGAGVILSHPGLAAGSGVVEGNGSGILGIGGDGEDLRITSSVPTTGSLDVLVSYFTIES